MSSIARGRARTPTSRMTAGERRDEILAAASVEFGQMGFAGATTDAIARRVGVSQPYLFQLFGTKKELFLAVVDICFDRTQRTFEEAGRGPRDRGAGPEEILMTLGDAYKRLLRDRSVLQMQLQAYAACGDPDVRSLVRERYTGLWRAVGEISGASPLLLHHWFAEGMLINVVASITEASTMEEFDDAVFRGVFGKV